MNKMMVEKARKAFEQQRASAHHYTMSLSFDELLELFSSECNTFSYIGEKAGVTRERIRQIYNQFFRPIYGKKDGRMRIRVCSRKTTSFREENAVPESEACLEACIRANAAGKTVDLLFKSNPDRVPNRVKPRSGVIKVNGKLVGVHLPKTPGFTGAGQLVPYFRTPKVMNTDVDFILVMVGESTFVAPASALEKGKGFYIPAVPREERGYTMRGRPPKIDWWNDYLEAWHLIP